MKSFPLPADVTTSPVLPVSSATVYRRYSSKQDLVVGALATLVPDRPPLDTGSLECDLRETLRRIAEGMSGDRGRLLLGLAGEVIRHPTLAEAARVRLRLPIHENLAAMLDRATGGARCPKTPTRRRPSPLIVGPLHYRLFPGETISPTVVETLVPMVLRAPGAGGGAQPATIE